MAAKRTRRPKSAVMLTTSAPSSRCSAHEAKDSMVTALSSWMGTCTRPDRGQTATGNPSRTRYGGRLDHVFLIVGGLGELATCLLISSGAKQSHPYLQEPACPTCRGG